MRLAAAFQNTAILANSAQFTDRGGKFLMGFSDDIQAKLKADDIPLMFAPMRVYTENKTVACGSIVLADRMLVIWSTGMIRMQTHIIEIWCRDVTSTNFEGTDVLTVDADERWRFSGFDDMAPVIRDMVAAALQQQFTYTMADSGFLSELSFTEIGMTFEYGN